MVRMVAIIGIMIFGVTGSADAAWLYQAKDDPFEKTKEHIVVGTDRMPKAVAFRCSGPGDVNLVFIPGEKLDREALALLPLVQSSLLLIVDDQPKKTIEAEMEAVEGGAIKASISGEDAIAALFATINAKQRLAVAIEFDGKALHKFSVNTKGAGGPLGKLVTACKLSPPS